MILLLSVFITSARLSCPNRYSRYEVFKYTLYSYRNIPFDELYLYILLDDEFKHHEQELFEYIHTTFSRLPKDKIHIVFDRYTRQEQWAPLICQLVEKHGMDELVWFAQNDDHVFIDFDMQVLNEGIELLKNDPSEFKSLCYSHWPEVVKLSGKFDNQMLIGNYVKFKLTILTDPVQIFNLKFLYHIFVLYKWQTEHRRIDYMFGFFDKPKEDNPFAQAIYVPLRELVRHFDGYYHINMDMSVCPPLELPSNTFHYDRETLIKKMTPYHSSEWARGNNFQIPQEWIDRMLALHPADLIEYTV